MLKNTIRDTIYIVRVVSLGFFRITSSIVYLHKLKEKSNVLVNYIIVVDTTMLIIKCQFVLIFVTIIFYSLEGRHVKILSCYEQTTFKIYWTTYR